MKQNYSLFVSIPDETDRATAEDGEKKLNETKQKTQNEEKE